MASFLDLFAPQWQEQQRQIQRDRFKSGLQQPELFNTENMPIPQMVQAYEKGYGMPYPQQQAPSPTAAIEGMTTDPNRGTTIQPPENMPVEYVQPRSLEESSIRGSEIKGRSDMAGKFAGTQYGYERQSEMEGMFPDAADDIGSMDIPATAGFKQYEPTEPGDSGDDPKNVEFKQNLDSYTKITGKVGRINPALAMMMGQMGSAFFTDPSKVQQLQGILTPLEQKIVQMNLEYLEGHFRKQRGGTLTQPEQEAATADQFLKDEGLR
jgi:hypothetical protein